IGRKEKRSAMGRSGDGRPPREGVGLDVNDARGAEGAGPGAGAPPVDDPRVREAERLLAERGVAGARVGVAGHQREIAAIVAPPVGLAPAIRALGFRYVALELE